MAQLSIRVNGRAYAVGCEDGEEARLAALAAIVDARTREASAEGAPGGETRALLLAALVLADDLLRAQEAAAAAQARAEDLQAASDAAGARAIAALEAAASRIEAMAAR